SRRPGPARNRRDPAPGPVPAAGRGGTAARRRRPPPPPGPARRHPGADASARLAAAGSGQLRTTSMRTLLLITVLALATTTARATDYEQAPGSSLVFAGTYQGEVFSGHFPGFQTTLRFDPADPASAKLEVDIPLAGVTTGNPDYDGEMRGAAFFDVGRYARARYVADGFRVLGDGSYAADGILELRGTSHPVTLAFTWEP